MTKVSCTGDKSRSKYNKKILGWNQISLLKKHY